MKRYSAGKNTDVRKRTETEAARPFGSLNKEEIEDIRQAYRDGCRGEILIGLRGDERVITMLVPAQPSPDSYKLLMKRSINELEIIGCDRSIRIRRSEAFDNSQG